MMMHNRKRRNEFFSVQQQMREDSLEAARLAYMTDTASEEQIAMVEEATARAKQAGVGLPSLLSTPHAAAPASRTALSGFGGEAAEGEEVEAPEKKKGGAIASWLFGGLKKEDVAVRDDELSFSREEAAARSPAGDQQQHGFRDKAKAAFEQERENQRQGGPLDQVGLGTPAAAGGKSESKKKGWLW